MRSTRSASVRLVVDRDVANEIHRRRKLLGPGAPGCPGPLKRGEFIG
jgi:hypothetical protein